MDVGVCCIVNVRKAEAMCIDGSRAGWWGRKSVRRIDAILHESRSMMIMMDLDRL